ncbi:MAG TPA: DNA polymerase III subunit beta, partial [Candidatus Nitrosocosmicus sp.]|nr:DNA polymerase III subunit beta [Candidatus Nitrosocosmicus sp.]
MKLLINNKTLQEKLVRASKFTMSKITSVPSLQGGMLKLSNGALEIITTNLNDFFYTKIAVESKDEFKVVVDIKKMVEFLSFLSTGNVELEIDKNNLLLKKEKTVGTFTLIPADDFPAVPTVEGKTYEIKKEFITNNLPLILFSVSRDESRPTLTGVNFLTREDTQYVVSTDGFRLSLISNKAEQELPPVTINAQILQEILSIGKNTKFVLSEKDKVVSFQMGDDIIYTRIIEGDFPPFERVIPQGFKTRMILETEELSRNIKLASVFARDFSSIIVFDIKKDGLYIKPKVKDDKGSVVYQEGNVEGEEQKISFNYKFVLDFLNNIKSKKITFEMNSSNAPGVFRA